VALLTLGLVIGVANATADGYLALLRSTAAQLKHYSELAMGRQVLERAVADESSLAPTRRDRTVVFLDIRGFTAWSERQSPEEVVRMLNAFYGAVESTVAPFWPIRIKYTADEALVVFAEPAPALAAARALREALVPHLAPFGLSAGFGIHAGAVIEGLLGSESVKAFDVLGDTVNVAKRLCEAAAGGEILVTAETPLVGTAHGPVRELQAKGKAQPLRVLALAGP
jgi:class 3 adenylate cyclase